MPEKILPDYTDRWDPAMRQALRPDEWETSKSDADDSKNNLSAQQRRTVIKTSIKAILAELQIKS